MKKFIKANPPRFWFLVGSVIVLILVSIGVQTTLLVNDPDKKESANVLVVVGSEKITKDNLKAEVARFFPGQTDISKNQKKNILEAMIEKSIVKQETTKLGIKLTDDDYVKALNRTQIFNGTLTDFQKLSDSTKEKYRQQARHEALKDKIAEKEIGSKTGNVAIARFDRTYEYEEQQEKPEQITKDKEYAKSLLDGYRNDITSGSKTIKEVMSLLDNDTKIGKPAWDNTLTYVFSFELTKTEYAQGGKLNGSKGLWEQIRKQTKGLSDVMLFKDSKALNAEDPAKRDDVDAFYALIQIDESKDGAVNFQEWLKKKYAEYKINVESIVID